jgi:uncharacterized protein
VRDELLLLKSFTGLANIACTSAGVSVGGLFQETDLEAELNRVELNCAGTVQLANHFVLQMTERGAGKILFTASIAGEMVAPGEVVSAATKAFVLSFAPSLRYELKDTEVTGRLYSLAPPTQTSSIAQEGTISRLARRANGRASQAMLPGKESTL